MTLSVHIARVILAVFFTLSLAAIPSTPAIENPPPACCCQTSDSCHETAPQSSCACTGCPVTLLVQHLAIIAEKNRSLPLPESAPRWNHRNEQATERRSAPPVPPPRITA